MSCKKTFYMLAFMLLSALFYTNANAIVKSKGIYINQGTLEKTDYLKFLIQESKAVGINTFIVDLEKPTRNYQKNINLIKSNGIKYVARIVVFPDGGRPGQIKSVAYWEKKFNLVKQAVEFGADAIQLDYIRYSTKQPPSSQNAKDIKQVIKWYKQKLAAYNVPLQIDIFGEVSFKESPRIGQNVQVFADTVDAVCPMVYPSHYHPYQQHSAEPYKTVYKSLTALKGKFNNNNPPFKLNAFIEASNYHYRWSSAKKSVYLLAQIKAVEDANADGWYVWSPTNKYNHLFSALKGKTVAAKNAKPNLLSEK